MRKMRVARFSILILALIALALPVSSFQSPSVIPSKGKILYPIKADYVIYKAGDLYYANFSETNEICFSGYNAAVVIKNAIGALSGNGGTILIKKGTYLITDRIYLPSNVWIFGEGADLTILKTGANIGTFRNKNYGTTGDRNISIGFMTLDGNAPTMQASAIMLREVNYVTITNIKIRNFYWDAIQVNLELHTSPSTPSQYLSVLDSVFDNNGRCGGKNASDTVAFHAVENFVVRNCTLTNGGSRLLLIGEHPATGLKSKNGLIQDVCLDGVAGHDALLIGEKSENITVESTFMRNANEAGSLVMASTKYIYFRNSEFSNNGFQGLLMSNSSHSSITNSVAFNNGRRNASLGRGFDIVGGTDINLSGTKAFNNTSNGFMLRSNPDFELSKATLELCVGQYNGQNGVEISKEPNDVGYVTVTLGRFNINSDYGILLNYPHHCTITYNNLTYNIVGSLYPSGTDHIIKSNIGYP